MEPDRREAPRVSFHYKPNRGRASAAGKNRRAKEKADRNRPSGPPGPGRLVASEGVRRAALPKRLNARA